MKCVERSDDANFAKRISQQVKMSASLPGWKHAKTPLKHVRHVASDQTTVQTIIARRLLNHSTRRRAVLSTHHLHTNALLFIPLKSPPRPYQVGLLCSLPTANHPALTLNHPSSSPPDPVTSRRILPSNRRRCSSTSAVCLFQSREKYNEDRTGSLAISMAVASSAQVDQTRTTLTPPRWAQGACCIRQDHSPCVEAVLRP